MIWPETIRTDRLVLRRPVEADATAIFDGYAQDPEVVRYLMWRPHASLEDTRAYLGVVQGGWDSATEYTWAITRRGEDRLIGMIAARPHGFKCDLGYVLARAYWGQGIVAEAGRAVVDLALADAGVYRVWAVCDVDNRASARVMEKLGMQLEGVLRRWVVHPNIGLELRATRYATRGSGHDVGSLLLLHGASVLRVTGHRHAEGSPVGRLTLDKQFHGDLEGTSKGEMLTAATTTTSRTSSAR